MNFGNIILKKKDVPAACHLKFSTKKFDHMKSISIFSKGPIERCLSCKRRESQRKIACIIIKITDKGKFKEE